MKVLLVEVVGQKAGHGSMYAKRLASGLIDLGNDVTLLTTSGLLEDWTQSLGIGHLKISQQSGIVRRLCSLRGALSRAHLAKIAKIVDELIYYYAQKIAGRIARRQCFDVVHFLGAYNAESLVAAFALNDGHPNSVVTIGDPFVKVSDELGKRKGLLGKLKLIFYERSKCYIAKKHKVIFHAEQVFQSFKDNSGSIGFSNTVIPWGMELKSPEIGKIEARRKIGIDYDGVLFLLFGQIRQDKGYDFFFNSFNPNEVDFKVLVAGKPMDVDVKALTDNDLWRDRTFLFTDYIPEEDIPFFFWASDAVVLPYKHNFVNASGVLSHACEYEVPIIGSDQGQIGQFIRQGGIGFTFKSEDPVQLKEAIRKFNGLHSAEIARTKSNIRKFVQEYSWPAVSKKHAEFYAKSS